MSKYIDADKLKQTFCAECNHTLKCEDCGIDYHFRYCAPAADVVEVVRCKDCKMYRKDKELAKAKYCDPNYYCALLQTEMDEDGFCSYGRRRDE